MTTSAVFVTIEFRSIPQYDTHTSHITRGPSVVGHRHRPNQARSTGRSHRKTRSQAGRAFGGSSSHDGSAQRRHGQLVSVPDVWLRSHHYVEGERDSAVRDAGIGGGFGGDHECARREPESVV